MRKRPELIVMLTHQDKTVANAYDIFDTYKNSNAKFWGLKEEGLPVEQMKTLFHYMKVHGKTTFLEVVSSCEDECLRGAQLAVECGCDILMGTTFSDRVNKFCQLHQLKYMPFVGQINDRPSLLSGTIEEMISEAQAYLEKGVYGIDLLAYRYQGDARLLIDEFIKQIKAPICLAGSIDSYSRLDEVKQYSPWAFTIGSGFFDNKFIGSFGEQIEKVYQFMGV